MSRNKSFRAIHWFTLLSGVLLLIAGIAVRQSAWGRSILHDEWKTVISDHYFRTVYDYLRPNRYAAALANNLYPTASIDIMRLPYVAFGLLAIVFAVLLGRPLRDRLVGVFLAALFVVWPFKAYYDTMMREYTVIMTFLVAALWLWERYRLRPTFMRFIPPLLLTAMISLTHETAPIVLCIPPLYVGWSFLPLCWSHFRRRLIDRRAFLRRLAVQSAQLVLLLIPCIFLYQYSLTRELPIAPSDTYTGPAKDAKVIPGPEQAFQFNLQVAVDLLKGGLVDPRPLYQTGTRDQSFQELLTGFRSEPFDSPGWLSVLVVPLLLIGSVLLVRRSVPLLGVCWALILINNMMLVMNFHLRSTTFARYWTFSLTASAILIATGLAALVHLLTWAAARRQPLRRVRLRFAAGTAAVVLLLALGFIPARRGAAYFPIGWGDPSEDAAMFDARAEFGGGPLLFMHHIEPYTWKFFSGLAAMRYERAGGDPLESPAHDLLIDINRGGMPRGIRLLDLANDYSGIVIRNTAAGNLMDEFAPFPHTDYAWLHEQYWFYPNRHNVYVTRGRLDLPPFSRFKGDLDTQGNRPWSFDLRHEIPGPYDLFLDIPAGQQPPGNLQYDGKPMQWELVTADSTSTASRFVMHYAAQGQLASAPVALSFTIPGDAYRPIQLSWRLGDVGWRAFTASLEAGPMQLWRQGSDPYIGLPMRLLADPPSQDQHYVIVLILHQGNPSVKAWTQRYYPNIKLRGIEPGGMFYVGPIQLPANIISRSTEPSLLTMELYVESPTYVYNEIITAPPNETYQGKRLKLGLITK